jgi:hypothetical protein
MNLPVYDPNVMPAVREMLYQRPPLATLEVYELTAALYVLSYLPYLPDEGAVMSALEALDLEVDLATGPLERETA